MGRPRNQGTAEERAQIRRDQVRVNVRALRRRKKEEHAHQELHQEQPGMPLVGLNTEETACTDVVSTANVSTRPSSPCEKQQIRLCHELRGSSLHWRLQFPIRICPGPAYRDVFIAAFSDATDMPEHEHRHAALEAAGRVHINVCCGTWVSSVCIQRNDHDLQSQNQNDLLSNALLAAALAFFGRITHDSAMMTTAMETEATVLSLLRQCLQQHSQMAEHERMSRICATVLTLALANLLIHKSWLSFALHLSGVAGLLQAAGPEMLVTPSAVDNFCGFRAVQLPFSFMQRKESFCSRREWIDFPGRASSKTACSPLHSFVDIAYEIPVLMQRYDEILLHNRQDVSSLYQLMARAWKIGAAIDLWEIKSGLSFPWASLGPSSSFSMNMNFEDTLTANAGAMVLGAKVGLFNLILEIETHMSRENDEDEATRLLQTSIEQTRLWSARAVHCASFFRDVEPRTVGKLVCLFPLDMAWKALCELRDTYGVDCVNDIEHCRMLAVEFESTGLPALRTHWSRSAA